MTPQPPRRTFGTAGLAAALAASLAVLLGGCLTDAPARRPTASADPLAAPGGPPPATSAGPGTIGTGAVKVALVLPLTGAGAGAAATLRNAADLALSEFQGPDLTILVKDDRGTADGAREATAQALAEGAELILGPLFAPSVAAAGQVARASSRPVIAFSTDASVASRGVYLLSFTVQPEVDRVLGYAAGQGRRSFAALIPETAYGNAVEAEFRESAARRNLRVAAVERYAPGQPGPAVERIASVIGGAQPSADAILIPDSGDGLAAVGSALQAAGFSAARVKPLGTGIWNDPRAARLPALAGGWYAVPESAGYQAFAGRYRARFGSEPNRIATLAYDAVSLAAALARTQGAQRFSEGALQTSSGFAGADGAFRFRADGTVERALAVMELRNGTSAPVSPAPKTLGSGT